MCLRICIFCCTFGRRLLEGDSYLAMLERIFQHSPEITIARCSPYTSVFLPENKFSLKTLVYVRIFLYLCAFFAKQKGNDQT